MLENTVLDLSILLVTAIWKKCVPTWWRLLTATLLGVSAGSLCLFYVRWFWLYVAVLFVVINPGMLRIAFGRMSWQDFVRTYLLAILMSVLLGGIFGFLKALLPSGFYIVLLPMGCILLVVSVIYLGIAKRRRETLVGVSFVVNGHIAKMQAFQDSGNCLVDQKTGMPVCIVSKKHLATWAIPEEKRRLLSYETVSGKANLEVFPTSYFFVESGGKKKEQQKAMLGFAEDTLFQGKEYQMILHKNYC